MKYAAIRWKKPKEKFAADHKEELDAYNTALRYFKVHLDGTKYSTKKLAEEQAQLSENIASKTEALTAVQEDVKILRDVRHWLNQVLPSEQYRQTAEPGKKPSIQQAVKGREQRIREEQAEKRQQPRRQQEQQRERKIRQQQDIEVDHSLDGRHLLSGRYQCSRRWGRKRAKERLCFCITSQSRAMPRQLP